MSEVIFENKNFEKLQKDLEKAYTEEHLKGKYYLS